jgi:hypothetical protein
MYAGGLRILVHRPLPPAPVLTPTYVSTQTTTTDETTSTFAGISIGTPHPKRIVVIAGHHGVAAAATGTCNGQAEYFRSQNTAHEFSLLAFFAPVGLTADITVSATGSIRKAFSIYYLYPADHMPIDSGTATATTTNNAQIANLAARARGCLIYAGGQQGTLGAFTTTFTGQTVTEDVDAQYETASSYTTGRISDVSVSSDTVTLDLAETVSGTKRLTAATWGPAWGRYV